MHREEGEDLEEDEDSLEDEVEEEDEVVSLVVEEEEGVDEVDTNLCVFLLFGSRIVPFSVISCNIPFFLFILIPCSSPRQVYLSSHFSPGKYRIEKTRRSRRIRKDKKD